jgi:hypothetical protein|tara:strand:- start:1099 stop:1227 length:129 start_codon:yes stop_codon:yes gene_type:complete
MSWRDKYTIEDLNPRYNTYNDKDKKIISDNVSNMMDKIFGKE